MKKKDDDCLDGLLPIIGLMFLVGLYLLVRP